jgi:hypothetical protein
MANPTQVLIASHTTASGGEASWTFSSISGTYTDLKIVISGRCNFSTTNPWTTFSLAFNGGSNLSSDITLYGIGSGAGSGNLGGSSGYATNAAATSNTFSNIEFYIPNYASSNYKSIAIDGVTENNGTAALQTLIAELWSSTSAITSITLTMSQGTLLQYSSFSLYGIKNS